MDMRTPGEPIDARQRVLYWIKGIKAEGFGPTDFARALGMTADNAAALISEPNYTFSWSRAKDLERLHMTVVRGVSPWGQMIEEMLPSFGTYNSLGTFCGLTGQFLHELHNKPTREPEWENGEKVMKGYAKFKSGQFTPVRE